MGRGEPLPPAQRMLPSPGHGYGEGRGWREEPADILAKVVMFGKVEIPRMAFAVCDPLSIAGKGRGNMS